MITLAQAFLPSVQCLKLLNKNKGDCTRDSKNDPLLNYPNPSQYRPGIWFVLRFFLAQFLQPREGEPIFWIKAHGRIKGASWPIIAQIAGIIASPERIIANLSNIFATITKIIAKRKNYACRRRDHRPYEKNNRQTLKSHQSPHSHKKTRTAKDAVREECMYLHFNVNKYSATSSSMPFAVPGGMVFRPLINSSMISSLDSERLCKFGPRSPVKSIP